MNTYLDKIHIHDEESSRISYINNTSSTNSSRQSSQQPLEMIPSTQTIAAGILTHNSTYRSTPSSSSSLPVAVTNDIVIHQLKSSNRPKPSQLFLVIDSNIFEAFSGISDPLHKDFKHVSHITIDNHRLSVSKDSTQTSSTTFTTTNINSIDTHNIVDVAYSGNDGVALSHSDNTNSSIISKKHQAAALTSSSQVDRYEFYTIDRGHSTIRWTKQLLHLDCSRDASINSCISYEPYVVLLEDNDAFIDLVLQSIDGYEFAALLQHINQSAGCASDGTSYNMNDVNKIYNPHNNVVVEDKARLMIVLMGIDKSANTRQKKLCGPSSSFSHANISISDWIDASISYLMYEAGVEVTRCKTPLEVCEYLETITRLAAHRETEELVTEIDCVNKANKEKPPDHLGDAEKENFELRQTWCAMLQMIPLASRDKAQAFVSFNDGMYSCPTKLYHSIYDTASVSGGEKNARYNSKQSRKRNTNSNDNDTVATAINTSTSQRADVVMDDATAFQSCFGCNKQGVARNQSKLSRHVFNLMTATDPNAMINDI